MSALVSGVRRYIRPYFRGISCHRPADGLLSGWETIPSLPGAEIGRYGQIGKCRRFALAAALALIGCLFGFNSANAQGAAMKRHRQPKFPLLGPSIPV